MDYNFLYNDDLEHQHVGIIVLGMEIAKIVATNTPLTERLVRILTDATTNREGLASSMSSERDSLTAEDHQKSLKFLLSGLLQEPQT